VVDAAGRRMGALHFADALWVAPQIAQANKHRQGGVLHAGTQRQ
jgi:hypothetical protein